MEILYVLDMYRKARATFGGGVDVGEGSGVGEGGIGVAGGG